MKSAALTEGPVGRQLLQLALPMTVGILAMFGFNMVDTLFVARLGTVPLAAMALTFPVVMVATSLGLGLGVSTSIAVSHAVGRGDRAAVQRLTTDALTMGLVLALFLGFAGALVLDPLLRLLEGDLPTHAPARAYLLTWLAGIPFVILPMVGSMAVRATGDTRTPSVLIIVVSLVNLVLDPLLIFGPGPFPALGIRGAALATVLSRAVSCAAILWVLAVRDRMLTHPLAGWRILRASWRSLARNAVPIALNNLITPLQVGILTRLVATCGTAAVAGFGVATRIETFTLTGVYALQSVIGVFIGQNAGGRQWDRVRAGILTAERFTIVYGAVGFVLLVSFGRYVNALFDANPLVLDAAQAYYLVVGVTLGMRALYLVDSAGLNALNRAPVATLLTVLHGFAIAVPVAWIGGRLFCAPGVFAGMAVGNVFAGCVTPWLLRRGLGRDVDGEREIDNG